MSSALLPAVPAVPPPSSAFVVGRWDGCHAWVQWDGLPGDRLQVRVAPPGGALGPWTEVRRGGPRPAPAPSAAPAPRYPKRLAPTPRRAERVGWAVVPLWIEGGTVQARVARAGAEDFTTAQAAEFRQARCLFRFASDSSVDLEWPAGQEFSAIVDGAPCHWRLPESLRLAAGGEQTVEMVAARLTGYGQLDYAGHFSTSPAPGVSLGNLGPSEEDLENVGGDAVLAMAPLSGPLRVVHKATL